jgi:hypothetical protein
VKLTALWALGQIEDGAPRTANAPAVAIDGVTRFGVALAVTTPAIRLRDVTPHADRFEIHHHLVAVIALVADDFFDALALGHDGLHLFGGLDQRFDARRGVALIRSLHRDAYHGTGLQIDGVLGLVRVR